MLSRAGGIDIDTTSVSHGSVRVERRGGAATLVIDRPSARNAISRPTMDELEAAIAGVRTSDARVLAVRGAGDRVFVSGGDLKELAAIRTFDEACEMARRMRSVLDELAALPIPVVGVLNGHAFGGGCEVAMACDFRIAAADVRLAFNQVQLGIMPAWGGLERLRDAVGPARALYLATSGATLSAAVAAEWGLVERVVERGRFDEAVDELLATIAAAPRDALAGIKRVAHPDAGRRASGPASEAVAAFAATWVADAHWDAVDRLADRRREGAT